MERQRIVKRVKLKMAEISDELQGQVIESPVIDEILDETVVELLLRLPTHLINSVNYPVDISGSMGNIYAIDSNVGYLILPTDFLRLSSFKMTQWHRPSVVAISETHPEYILQTNQYTRGGIAKPVTVLKDAGGERRLYYYSVTDNDHEVDHFYYVKSVLAENLQSNLIDPLTWMCAAKALEIYSEDGESIALANKRVEEWITLNLR